MRTQPQYLRRRPGPAKTFLRWVQNFFLLAGVVALGWYAFVQTETLFFQTYQSWRLDQLQQGKPATVTLFVKQWLPISWKEGASPQSPTASWGRKESSAESADYSAPRAEGELIGKLEIPRLDLSAIVLEGTDAHTLRLAVGHLPGTPLPGEPGNVDLAAHRDSFFRGLNRIHQGDVLTMSTVGGASYQYRVETVAVVSPNNTSSLNSSAGPGINLITCYPFNYVGAAPKRFVVHANQISANLRMPDSQAMSGGSNRLDDAHSSMILAASLIHSPSFAARPASKLFRHSASPREAQNSLAGAEVREGPTVGNDPAFTGGGNPASDTSPKSAAKTSLSHSNPLRAFFRKIFKPKL
jgi:sortase A